MKRAEDPAYFNACISQLILAAYECEPARWEASVVLEFEDGCVAFERSSPGVYSAHWCFLPKAKDVVRKGKEALRYLFTKTGALRVTGKTPHENKAAQRAARKVGMRWLFDCPLFQHTALTRAEWSKEG